jgi:uncharacterized membrane protein
MARLIFVLTFLSALGSGLVGGAFFAFSTFVMKALGRIAPAAGIAAMQSINVVVLNPLFLGTFVGTALISLLLGGAAFFRWSEPGTLLMLAGAGVYVVGSFIATMTFSVPLNDALAAVAPESPEGAHLWASYLGDWTFWNHVRTLASLIASAFFILALCQSVAARASG